MSAPVSSAAPSTAAVSALAMAEAARRMQLQLRAKLLRDTATAWAALDFDRLAATWPGWLQLMNALVTRYHGQASQQAALYYLAARQAATATTDGAAPVLATAPAVLWVERSLGYAAPGTYLRLVKSGQPTDVAARGALTQTLGTASRVALDGARTTIVDTAEADDAAIGWFRVTDGDPCAFCALLASRPVIGGRGALYRSKTRASFAAHNDCGCTAAPMFSRDQELPALSGIAADVYQSRGDGPALVAFRKAWAERKSASRP